MFSESEILLPLITFLVIFQAFSAVDRCEEHWTLLEETCFKAFENVRLTYTEAYQMCQNENARLPNIITAKQQRLLTEWLLNSTEGSRWWTAARKASHCFLGEDPLTDEEPQEFWKWPNFGEFEYTNWHQGEPSTSEETFCMVIQNLYPYFDNYYSLSFYSPRVKANFKWQEEYEWAAISCEEKSAAVCEKPACANTWEAYKGACYKFYPIPRLTFAEAQAECAKHNAKLVSIQSWAKDKFLNNWLIHNTHVSFWWTAGQRRDQSTWMWNGLNLKFGYTNWLPANLLYRKAQQQPVTASADQNLCMNLQNRAGKPNDHGVKLDYFGWAENNCNDKLSFICQRGPWAERYQMDED